MNGLSTRVLILLSTFNGEQFLKQQLDSILSQKDVEIKLLVRDDGSTDRGATIRILRLYQSMLPHKIDIILGDNIGWRKSFMALIHLAAQKYRSYNFFAFADQDDIWLPDKLMKGLSCFISSEEPQLYCSNLFVYKDGKNIGELRTGVPNITKENALIRNYAIGCTVIFNNELLLFLHRTPINFSVPHDFWAYQVAMMCGRVFYDSQSYILYRQHECNQVGVVRTPIGIWKRRIRSILAFFHDHKREQMAKMLLKLYSEHLNPIDRIKIEKIANYRESMVSRLSLIIDNRYTTNMCSNDFWLKLRILCGRL